MRKLNQKKVKWIIREIDTGERSVYRIAKRMDITPQWAREIHRFYHETGEYPFPNKPGRKKKVITDEEKELILKTREEHPLAGACAIEKLLDEKGIHIPHNRIHRFLKDKVFLKMNLINRNGGNGFVMNEDLAIVFGMQIGSKSNWIVSSFFRMMHHDSLLDMVCLNMQRQKTPYMCWVLQLEFMVFPSRL